MLSSPPNSLARVEAQLVLHPVEPFLDPAHDNQLRIVYSATGLTDWRIWSYLCTCSLKLALVLTPETNPGATILSVFDSGTFILAKEGCPYR